MNKQTREIKNKNSCNQWKYNAVMKTWCLALQEETEPKTEEKIPPAILCEIIKNK